MVEIDDKKADYPNKVHDKHLKTSYSNALGQTEDASVIVNLENAMPMSNIEGYEYTSASEGDLYSRHMRVQYIFRCF